MAVRDDFSPGEVLTSSDLNDTFASKVDYALPTNAQTGTTYTFVAADAEKLTTASNGSAVTLTIPPASSVAWPDNTVLRVVNYGAGAVTIDGGSGVTVTNTASTVAQYGAAVAIRTGSDAWTVVPFGGGDVPAAEVSSPSATGQYTDGSGDTWDYYTFTSSGTLTVDTAGFADILVIAGGGGTRTGRTYEVGGGAGGMLELSDAYLPAGSLTVTVGAGGVNTNDGPTNHGNDSVLDTFVAVGGGGGGRSNVNGYLGYGDSGGSGSGASSSTSGLIGGKGVTNQGNDGGQVSSGFGAGGGAGGAASGGTAGVGRASSITGSSVTYAAGGASSGTNTANTGDGGQGNSAGNSGVVIVRVKV